MDLGFDVRRRDSFRLYGINAPETRTPEGVAAKEWLVALLAEGARAGQALTINTIKDRREKYGRYLAVLWLGPLNVNLAAIDQGHAVEYMP